MLATLRRVAFREGVERDDGLAKAQKRRVDKTKLGPRIESLIHELRRCCRTFGESTAMAVLRVEAPVGGQIGERADTRCGGRSEGSGFGGNGGRS
jgi:hypothetical protein